MATWRKTLSSNQYYEVILNINQTSQNIANNTSNISWSLQVRKSFGSGFWGADGTASTWTVTIDGTNVSSSSSSYDFRGGAPLTKTIASGTRTITHAGDGSKSIAVSGYWKDNANGLGSATASGTMALSTIPRATTLSAFSFASHLKNGVANTINYTVSKKSTSFRQQIQLRDGSTTVFEWDNSNSNGNSTITLTAANVNTLLSRMPTNTTKTFTLRIATRNGVNGGWIGSAVTRNATATVHTDVKPTISGQSFGINLERVDQQMGKYIQGFTKVDAVFTPTAGYGSSIQSSSMTVQKTDGSDSQVISGNRGTTGRVVLSSGTYRVLYNTTDTRGRSTSAVSSNFTVQPYSAPRITIFNLFRREATPTTVYVGVAGEFSSIGTSNLATLIIERRSGGGGTWEKIGTNNTSNTGGIYREVEVPNNLITSSYEYRGIITDRLGGRVEAVNTISTQRVVLDIHKNEGVGIGKIHERGVLDVDGEAYVRGVLTAQVGATGSALRVQSDRPNGHGYVGYFSSDSSRKAYVGFGSPTENYFEIANEHNGGDIRFMTNTGQIRVNWDYVVSSGSSNNGHWVRFYNGIQICYGQNIWISYNNNTSVKTRITMPSNFVDSYYAVVLGLKYTDAQYARGQLFYENKYTGNFDVLWRLSPSETANVATTWGTNVDWTAIGRWK